MDHKQAVQRAVYIAVEKQQDDILEHVIKHYSKHYLNEASLKGDYILHTAINNDDPLCSSILMNHGAICDEESRRLISGKKDISIKNLLEHIVGGIRKSTQQLWYNSSQIIIPEKELLLRYLLQKKPDVNSIQTAFMQAAYYGYAESVERLLAAGAKLGLKCKDGNTALILAASNGHVECVETLLAAGACTDSKNSFGITACQIAGKAGHRECVKLIMNAAQLKNGLVNDNGMKSPSARAF